MGVWFTLIFQWEGMYNIISMFVLERDKYIAIIYINENKFLDEMNVTMTIIIMVMITIIVDVTSLCCLSSPDQRLLNSKLIHIAL